MPGHPASPPPLDDTPRWRSGTAARLAGLPVTTLRVWERRYGVVAAPKTPTGQRLYSAHDVQRLGLLKQLTTQGHAIGPMAALDLPALQALTTRTPASPGSATTAVVVVGRGAARKLQAATGRPALAVYDGLVEAEADIDPAGPTAVLLAHLPSLQPAAAERLLALAARVQAGHLVVLYAFGAEAVADTLRAAGATVSREPASGRDLARLVAMPVSQPPRVPPPPAPPVLIPARRYSDEALASLAEMVSPVACECPRHVAEIVMQLAGFERYSAECSNRTPADAALHQHLSEVAATARSLFEQALARVIAEEGLPWADSSPVI